MHLCQVEYNGDKWPVGFVLQCGYLMCPRISSRGTVRADLQRYLAILPPGKHEDIAGQIAGRVSRVDCLMSDVDSREPTPCRSLAGGADSVSPI